MARLKRAAEIQGRTLIAPCAGRTALQGLPRRLRADERGAQPLAQALGAIPAYSLPANGIRLLCKARPTTELVAFRKAA